VFHKRYVSFLNELSKLAKKYDELSDTDVRERLHEVINYYFVWGKPMKGFPKRFDMMSDAADRAMAACVRKFVADARRIAEESEVGKGAPRHALLEDPKAKTRRGECYDVFLGSSDKVLRAKKPAPDSSYARKPDSRRKVQQRPMHDPASLSVTVGGQQVVPTFNAQEGWYRYELSGHSIGYSQEYFSADAIRKLATNCLSGKPQLGDLEFGDLKRKERGLKAL
jgi:hypothetical protein